MKKETMVMVSDKVLKQMLAYRKYNKYYASYREAVESIGTEIEKFRTDSFRVSLIQQNIPTSPSLFVRSFQNLLVSIAAKCLLTAGECGAQHLRYDEIFNTFFEVAGEMMDQVVESGNQTYDTMILGKFDNFKSGINNNYAATFSLYQIAVYCIFLYNYIECNKPKRILDDKILVTVTPAGIKLNNRIYFDVKLRDYLHQEVLVAKTHQNSPPTIIDVYNESDVLICSAVEINTMVEAGGGE